MRHEQRVTTRPAGSVVRVLAAVGVLAMVAAACGDDAEAITKADLVARADAICQETNDVVDPMFDEFYEVTFADMPEGPTTPEENQVMLEAFDALFDEIGPHLEDQMEQIRALGTPDDDEGQLTALYDDFDVALDEMRGMIDDAVAGDEEAIHRLTAEGQEDPMAEVNTRARVYGFDVCGSEQ